MRKWLFSMLGIILACSLAFAQPVEEPVVTEEPVVVEEPADPVVDIGDTLEKVPSLKQGVVYLVEKQDFEYFMSAEVLEFKGLTLEIGYAPSSSIVSAVSYRLIGLKDLGVNTPLLDLIEFNVGVTGRVDFDDNKDIDWGPSVTLINVKF